MDILTTAACAILCADPCSGAEVRFQAPDTAALRAAADAYLGPLMDLDVFDGAVLVARQGEVLLERGYGMANYELGVQNTPAQRFRIASISKPFTAMAIGRLQEQGVLTLDTPLATFLADFPGADRITIEHLLRHRAGVPNLNSLPYDEEAIRPNTLTQLVEHLRRKPLDFEPGTRRRYSNGGYALLAHVIEKASGKSYGDYLQEEVLRPLGLKDTGHEPDGYLLETRAYGYMPAPDQLHGRVPAPFQEMATKTGGGSLYATVGDLFRWGEALFRDNALRRRTYEALFPASKDTVEFSGRSPGFNAYFLKLRADDVTVVVLSNNYASGMLERVAHDLAAMALGRPYRMPQYRADLQVDPIVLARYAGTYDVAAGTLPFPPETPIEVRLGGGHLVVVIDGTPIDALVPQSGRTFLARNLWTEMTFDASAGTAIFRPLYREGPVALRRREVQR